MASEVTGDTVSTLRSLGYLPVGYHPGHSPGLLSTALNPLWSVCQGQQRSLGEQVQGILLLPLEDIFGFPRKILFPAIFPSSFSLPVLLPKAPGF